MWRTRWWMSRCFLHRSMSRPTSHTSDGMVEAGSPHSRILHCKYEGLDQKAGLQTYRFLATCLSRLSRKDWFGTPVMGSDSPIRVDMISQPMLGVLKSNGTHAPLHGNLVQRPSKRHVAVWAAETTQPKPICGRNGSSMVFD